MLIIKTSASFSNERLYVLGVILTDILGLEWRHLTSKINETRVSYTGEGREIIFPDVFFSMDESMWLTTSSLPALPLISCNVSEIDGVSLYKETTSVPVIYGVKNQLVQKTDSKLFIPIDIFGSAFFMLSRYEECVPSTRDKYDRFPAEASLAYKEGFLDRPIVNEYIEILSAALEWLNIPCKPKADVSRVKNYVSCDVDHPYSLSTTSIINVGKQLYGDLVRRKNLNLFIKTFQNFIYTKFCNYKYESYDTFDWIMSQNEKFRNQLVFYFIVDHFGEEINGHYTIDEPRILDLLKRIGKRKHEIGLHGSFYSYQSLPQMKKELTCLQSTIENLKIKQKNYGIRQHFLRWDSSLTPSIIDSTGINYDTSLGYAEQPGFRTGTCCEYQMYDVIKRRQLNLKQRPLIVMEKTIFSTQYLGMPKTEETIDFILEFKQKCHFYNGQFSLLWHNNNLIDSSDKYIYQRLIS